MEASNENKDNVMGLPTAKVIDLDYIRRLKILPGSSIDDPPHEEVTEA